MFLSGAYWRFPVVNFQNLQEICDGADEPSECSDLPTVVDERQTRKRGGDSSAESVLLPEGSSGPTTAKTVRREEGGSVEEKLEKRLEKGVVNPELLKYITAHFDHYVISPTSGTIQQKQWVSDRILQLVSAENPTYKQALNNREVSFSFFTFDEFKNFYRARRQYIFRPSQAYWTVERSVVYAEQWLEAQCGGTMFNKLQRPECQYPMTVKGLLQLISDVVFMRYRKFNCLQLTGTFNVGKSWFTDMLLDFCINRADLKDWNRYMNGNFPFQELVNRRIAIWNEPTTSGDKDQINALKTLFGGETTSTSVKHKKNMMLYRIPIIVTTNDNVYNNHDCFYQRRVILHCVPCRFEYDRALHPFALLKLFKKYDIATHVVEEPDLEEPKETQYVDSDDEVCNVLKQNDDENVIVFSTEQFE